LTTERLQVGPHKLEVEWVGPARNGGPGALGPGPGGPVLVFLHEGLGCVGLWRDFPKRLCDACGLPGFVFSRSGYGQSSAVPLPRLPSYMHDEAALLPHVLAAAGIGDCVLFGHSDGASISLLFAGALGGAPAPLVPQPSLRLRGLVLEAPHLFAEEVSLKSIARMRDAWQETDLKSRLARWHRDPDAAFWGWCGPWLDPAFRRWNIESSLPGVTVPAQVIQGEDDEYGTSAQLTALHRGSRGPVEMVLLPECGHSPHRDQPEKVLEAVRGFVARCVAAGEDR
jgi:pimeloyl-ACP methyl ester carboxylesterase